MKLLFVSGNGGFAIGPIAHEVIEGLRELGHEATLVSVAHFVANNALAQAALRRQRPDFVLGYNWSSLLTTTTGGDFFGALGIPKVVWLFDDPFDHYDERTRDPAFRERLRSMSATRVYCWDAVHVQRLREHGVLAHHLPPGWRRSLVDAAESLGELPSAFDVGVLGNVANDARQALLERVCEGPYRVRAHVARVETGRALSAAATAALAPPLRTDEERARFYRGAAIYLETPSNTGRGGINPKILDAMAVGAFVLAPESPELRAAFGDDTLATYRDAQELDAQVARFLAAPELRRAIAERGRALVRREHSMRARARRLAVETESWLRGLGKAPRPARAAQPSTTPPPDLSALLAEPGAAA